MSLFSGNAVSGVLTEVLRHDYVLKGCMVHEPGVEPQPADGEILIDRANVDYIQIVGD